MFIYRRVGLLLTIFLLTTGFLKLWSRDSIKSSRVWRDLSQKIGPSDWVDDGQDDGYRPQRESVSKSPLEITTNSKKFYTGNGALGYMSGPSRFAVGTLKPLGSKYTKAVVLGRMPSENVTWLDEAALPAEVKTYIYGIDDPHATLRGPKNKGREAMIYLSYIIDHYDSLPDVSIFLHAHRMAWHNNELLNHDATEMIKRLSSERVTREGYMNLRCHWVPGCPEWLNPRAIHADQDKPEEGPMAEAWATLFPDDAIPANIGSACCAQFAVSRERIHSVPLSKFKHYRDWLLRTSLPDQISGRIFEYLWAKIFTDQSAFCPDQRVCYCDGYGVCFENEKEFDYWFELKYKRGQLFKQLDQWQQYAAQLGKSQNNWGSFKEKGAVISTPNEDTRLEQEINVLSEELEKRRLEALRRGVDPQVRARVAGRPWKEGDGY